MGGAAGSAPTVGIIICLVVDANDENNKPPGAITTTAQLPADDAVLLASDPLNYMPAIIAAPGELASIIHTVPDARTGDCNACAKQYTRCEFKRAQRDCVKSQQGQRDL